LQKLTSSEDRDSSTLLAADPGNGRLWRQVIKEWGKPEAIERWQTLEQGVVRRGCFTASADFPPAAAQQAEDSLMQDWGPATGPAAPRAHRPACRVEEQEFRSPAAAADCRLDPLQLKDRIQEQEVAGP